MWERSPAIYFVSCIDSRASERASGLSCPANVGPARVERIVLHWSLAVKCRASLNDRQLNDRETILSSRPPLPAESGTISDERRSRPCKIVLFVTNGRHDDQREVSYPLTAPLHGIAKRELARIAPVISSRRGEKGRLSFARSAEHDRNFSPSRYWESGRRANYA